jgi:hypothetical protein
MPEMFSAEAILSLLLSILERWMGGRLCTRELLVLVAGLATEKQNTMLPANILVGEVEWRDEDILFKVMDCKQVTLSSPAVAQWQSA